MTDEFIYVSGTSRKGGDTLENEVIRGQTLLCVILVFTWTHIPGHQFAAKREREKVSRAVCWRRKISETSSSDLMTVMCPPPNQKEEAIRGGHFSSKWGPTVANPCCVTLTCLPLFLFYFLRMISNNITLLMIRFGIYKHSLGRCYYIYCTNYYLKFLKKDNPIAFSTWTFKEAI